MKKLNEIKYWGTKLEKNQEKNRKNNNQKNKNNIWYKNKINQIIRYEIEKESIKNPKQTKTN